MAGRYSLTVAPNGSRLGKADHIAVPISQSELAETARACFGAGANAIHLHIRDNDGAHSLDARRYRATSRAIKRAAPGLKIQITTESGGVFGVDDQMRCIQDAAPDAASVSVREIARVPELAAKFYGQAEDIGTSLQHILYSPDDIDLFESWVADGTIPKGPHHVLIVLGRYATKRAAQPEDLKEFSNLTSDARTEWTVCAFGPHEQDCLLAAIRADGNVRVGFENNTLSPDGTEFADNKAAVLSLIDAAAQEGFQVMECTP